jgi:hypothetical protein
VPLSDMDLNDISESDKALLRAEYEK